MSVFSRTTPTEQERRRLILKHGHKRVKVKRQTSYDLMLDSACKHFPTIPRDVITLQSNELDDCDGRYVDITADMWDDVVDLLTIVRVTQRVEMTSPVTLPFDALAISSPDDQPGPSQVERRHNSYALPVFLKCFQLRPHSRGIISIKLVSSSGNIKTTQVSRHMRVDRFAAKTAQISGGYPSLMPSFEWNVRTHGDGSLTEYNSGLDVAYLFWEAETNSHAFPRSPASEPQPLDTFSPTSSSLGNTNSVVIPVNKASTYLDKSLQVLGLHTEARTSFITYWLPSILKHEYIALRFVSQAAYERAASLSISPQPDVVTRVFMLFKGIHKEYLANWANSQMQAEKDVGGWVDGVGVDPARAGDPTLLRVLEWGGMELVV
ncbi:hypothetical protein EDD22DRAFT_996130 [Suillus occidentalis]|nr:hypothetical protein EDD22DRAFT_996130 [Suillus occidentalis]